MSDEPQPEEEQQEPDGRNLLITLAIVVEGGLIALAWGMGWFLDQPALKHFSFDPIAALWGVLATVPLLLAVLVMMRWPIGPLRRL